MLQGRYLYVCKRKFAQLSFDKEIMGMSATFLNLTKLLFNSPKFSETEWAQQLLKAQKFDSMKRTTNSKKFADNRPVSKTFALSQRLVVKSETSIF